LEHTTVNPVVNNNPLPIETLGSYLKKTREDRNISVEQVAYATRISLKMLRALEEDDHGALPAPTFVRGYLQAYAKYVRIDTNELLDRYQQFLSKSPESGKGAIRSHYLYVKERYQETRRLVLVIVLFASMLSVVGTYFLLKAKREKNQRLAQQAEQVQKTPEAVAPAAVTGTPATAANTQASPPATPPSATATPAPTSPAASATPANPPPSVLSAPTPTPPPTAPATPIAAPPPAPAATVTAPPAAPAISPSAAEPRLAEPTPPSPASPLSAAMGGSEKKTHNLLLKANEDVWLRFQTDNNEVRDLTLRAGKQMMLRADQVIKIFSGNLNAMSGRLNGQDLPSLSSGSRTKSAVFPASEAPKFPPPIFPQFANSSGTSTPSPRPTNPNSGGAGSSPAQPTTPGGPTP
jgi:cytoskeleton protein RodZ